MTRERVRLLVGVGLACGALGALGACGDDEDSGGGSDAKKVDVVVKDAGGGKFTMTAPKTVEAGLTEISLTAPAGASHDAQLIRVEGDHSSAEILKFFSQE